MSDEEMTDEEKPVLELRDNDKSYELKGKIIQFDQILDLADKLKNHKNLTELTLENIGLEYKGACEIAGALVRNKKLAYLSLANNPNIGYKGFKEFGVALKINKTLKTLILTNTGLDKFGVNSLSLGLRDNTTLTVLNLDGNEELDLRDHETNLYIFRINLRLSQSQKIKDNQSKQQLRNADNKRIADIEESESDSDIHDRNWCCC